MRLEAWGWNADWETVLLTAAPAGGAAARVLGQDRGQWTVGTTEGPRTARATSAARLEPYPTVGDWVVVTPGPTRGDPLSLVAVLPRRTVFSRGSAADGRAEQALAANVDEVWIVHGLDSALNARRLERYLALAWQSGAQPAIVLTKADLAAEPEAVRAEARTLAFGAPVHLASAEDADHLEALRSALAPGRTVALLGPSGAGKSTLINALAGAILARTGDVRARDHKGRHTTTRRELFQLPGGGLVIDTPGLRALRLWEVDEGLERAFPDVEEIAADCRFRDCRHDAEPGCAVLEAVAAGALDRGRLESYRKLQAEAAHETRRADPLARRAAVAAHKTALKTLKHHIKRRGSP